MWSVAAILRSGDSRLHPVVRHDIVRSGGALLANQSSVKSRSAIARTGKKVGRGPSSVPYSAGRLSTTVGSSLMVWRVGGLSRGMRALACIGLIASARCDAISGVDRLVESNCVGRCDGGMDRTGQHKGDGSVNALPSSASEASDSMAESDVPTSPDSPREADVARDARDHPDAISESADATADSADATSDAAASPAHYLGCFADSPSPNSLLAYNDLANTTERCVFTCRADGYSYAGTRASSECSCTNVYGGQGPSNNCNISCSGNGSEMCGGTAASSVYYTTTPPQPPQSVGCFGDRGMTRDLPYEPYDNTGNTAERCVAACTSHGYLYAGTQYSDQCYCGDTYGAYGLSTGCTSVCGGNPMEICGGAYANSVYRTTVLKEAGRD